MPGARIDVRTVETGPPTPIPISIRVLGENATTLHLEAERLTSILKSSPLAINIRDDWGNYAIRAHLEVDQDRASLAGLSSQDIAISSYSGVSGLPVGVMREGRKNIPIVQLMNYGQRDTATALNHLYVYSSQAPQNVTLGQIARLTYTPEAVEIHRVNQYRAITVSSLARPGHVASEVTDPLMPQLRDFESHLTPGYRMEIVGELKEQLKGQGQSLNVVMASVIRDLSGAGLSVQERDQTIHRLRQYTVRSRRSVIRRLAHAHATRIHGDPWNHESDRGDREPRDRLVRLH